MGLGVVRIGKSTNDLSAVALILERQLVKLFSLLVVIYTDTTKVYKLDGLFEDWGHAVLFNCP